MKFLPYYCPECERAIPEAELMYRVMQNSVRYEMPHHFTAQCPSCKADLDAVMHIEAVSFELRLKSWCK